MSSPTTPSSVAISYGDVVSGSIEAMKWYPYTFSGTSGEQVLVRVRKTGGDVYPAMSLRRPDGSQLCSNVWPNEFTSECTLNVTGTYTIWVYSKDGDQSGTFELTYGIPQYDPWTPVSNPSHPHNSTKDPVNVATGDFSHSHTDLAIPGKGVPLQFTRYYHSGSKLSSGMGSGWTHTYDMYLTFDGSNVNVFYPEGYANEFTLSGGAYHPRDGVYDTLVKNQDNTYALTTKDQISYNFTSAGKLASVADRNGNTTTLSYDGNGFLDYVTDASGRSLDFDVDANGRITQITDPLDRTVSFQYDGNGDLVEVTDAKGGTTAYTYSNHHMTSLTDANNHVATQNVYWANRVVEQTDAVGGKTCLYYGSGPAYTSGNCPGVTPSPQAGQTVVVDPRGNKTTYAFDSSFRTTQATDALSGVTSYAYDSNDNRTCVTDPLGHKTGYAYDSKGNVTQVIDALNTQANCTLKQGGVRWTFTYTAKNDVDLATDPLGRQTDYVYDGDGNLTEVIRKDDGGATKARTCFTRDSAGLMTELIESTNLSDCTGNKTKFEYDSYGNQTAVVDPRFSGQEDPPETTFTYDLGGRLLTVTNELGHTTTYTYDAQNNVLTVTDNLGNVTTYTYDAKGNLETITDANDKLTTYDYDDADRLTSVVDALDQTTSYEYDGNGNRTSVTNANDKTTTYAYDALNRLESVTDPLSRVTSYEYDAAGNLSQRTDGNGQTTTYTYDVANRLTGIDYPVGTADVSYTYDAVGNRETMEDGTGTTSYDYDDLNRLTSVTFPGSRTVGYGYDNVGDRTSITYPGGSNEVAYTYDQAHNLSTVTDWNDAATTYSYDDAGQLAEAVLPNGVVSTYTHDGADRLTGITHVKGQNTLASVEYTLDAVGNRTERVDQLGTHTYNYDDLYRLTEVTYPGPSTTSYTYDPVGNRGTLVDGSGTTTYAYDDADQLTSVTPPGQSAINYTWDDNGNLSERGADTYDWNAENRMTSATVGGATTAMAYNGDGLRDSRTVGEDSVTFTWDVAASIPQVVDDGSLSYVYGLGRVSQVGAAGTFYYLSDGLGSAMALTDASGNVVNTYNYDVFGSVRSQTGSQPNEFLFTGEQVDDSTSLQYLRARYYDPAIGRFLSRDPFAGLVQVPQSLNRYAYVLNNPVIWLDPWGLRNVEGTPTPTPAPYYSVCGPARQAECLNRHLLNPSSGRGPGELLSAVGSILGFFTSRSPACYGFAFVEFYWCTDPATAELCALYAEPTTVQCVADSR
jgi:RHS repeat-associated protein